MNIEQLLLQAKLYIRQNQKKQAGKILVAILKEYPNSAEAWLLCAQLSDDLEQVLYCLQRASQVNPRALESHPNAPQIRAIITRLRQPLPSDSSTLSEYPPLQNNPNTQLQTQQPLRSNTQSGQDSENQPELEPEDSPLLFPTIPSTEPVLNPEPEDELNTATQDVLEISHVPLDQIDDSFHMTPVLDNSIGDPSFLVRKKKGWRYWVAGLAVFAIMAIGVVMFGGKLQAILFPDHAVTIAETSTIMIRGMQVSEIDSMSMVLIPAGRFLMGSDSDELLTICGLYYSNCTKDSLITEEPVHTVYLDAYWIDQTEVTNGMYAKCVAAGNCQAPGNFSSSTRTSYYGDPQYLDYPVIFVDQNDAKTYCQWTGRRLPTETEWEKAARGENGFYFPWGNSTPTCEQANFLGDAGSPCIGDTTVVGSHPVGISPYGAMDMAGNVWEWTEERFDQNYYRSLLTSNPTGPNPGKTSVLRGGSWLYNGYNLRSANRGIGVSSLKSDNLGFRCALTFP